jgi:hypothetical protein
MLNCEGLGMAHFLLSCEEPYRSDLKPARTSSEKSFGCSQAANSRHLRLNSTFPIISYAGE